MLKTNLNLKDNLKLDHKSEKRILSSISKPARYIGNEFNQIKKDFLNTKFTMALSYPDLYELGMSNLGIKILYEIVNNQHNMLCERVFHPWSDMQSVLLNMNVPLYSLENKVFIKHFDILGFSLQYELTFTNVLSILNLSHIPIQRIKRNNNYPIVIAGGPCAYNPKPLADFIDVFLLGEAEEGIVTFANKIIMHKQMNSKKEDVLKDLAELDFLYVPAFSKDKYIRKLTVENINTSNYPTKPPIANTQATQDNGVIEVARGCTVGCRFCQAGNIYRPLRERSIDNILELAKTIIKNTGYKSISLLSLSIADYTNLSALIDRLNERFSDRHISFSFPSLRIDAFSLQNALKIKKVRKTALTFAVEAGSEYIRNVINKIVSEEKLFEIVKEVTNLGWRHIKLYFMLGFPLSEDCENKEEDEIINLVKKLLTINNKLNISVSVGTFVPKSHTPFERAPQITREEAFEKIQKIRMSLKSKRVKLKTHSPDMSFVEGLIARGDERIGQLIYKAYEKGSRFDGWGEEFKIDNWLEAIKELEVDIDYALFNVREDRELPWSRINSLVTTKFLKKEEELSLQGVPTPDCRDKCIEFCGVCHKPLHHSLNDSNKDSNNENIDNLGEAEYLDNLKSLDRRDIGRRDIEDLSSKEAAEYTVIINYTKLGLMKYLSHIDMFNMFQKAFLRAGIPITFSNGFNPIPKIDISNPLALGIESNDEYMQIKLTCYMPATKLKEQLNKELIDDFVFVKAIYITDKAVPKINKLVKACEYELSLPYETNGQEMRVIRDNMLKLQGLEYIKSYRKDKSLKSALEHISLKENKLTIILNTDPLLAKLFDYLNIVTGLEKEELIGHGIRRVRQYGSYEEDKSPIDELNLNYNTKSERNKALKFN